MLATLLVALGATGEARAQHAHHPTAAHEAPAPAHAQEAPAVLGIPMTRHGSGTAWLPDASPMRAFHATARGWSLMLHGSVFVGYDLQGSDAGDRELVSQNWLMAMAERPVAGGVFEARAMVSLEPLTLGDDGYPLLLQTGETLDGEPLIDRQHPHDLWMELAARYQREVGGGLAIEAYGALAGEPALGPPAFPHRPSAMADPFAPLGHHWLDATHISFGVLTAGVFSRRAKLEGSWFNGREPDEQRHDLDLAAPDSYAARLTVNPSPAWSAQVSYGHLASPEALEPDHAVQRVTASAVHARPLGAGHWTSTAAWGRNTPEHGPAGDAFLVESAVELAGLGTTFARLEYVEKTGHDFGDHAMPELALPVAALALGHVHPLGTLGGVETGLGVRGAVGLVDDELEPRYRTRTPFGVMAYVSAWPALR